MRSPAALARCVVPAFVLSWPCVARGDDRPATPTDYRAVVTTLRPGDTMRLAAGRYGILSIANLHGTPAAPIVIEGPAEGASATFVADSGPCCNTVEIRNAEYVVLRNVTIDGHGVAGAFGVSAGGLASNVVHHVTIEGCTFLGHDGSQQTVAISTKTPTWGWVIRNNIIRGAGTGLYLGNSDGSQPFVGGLIEGNLITDTIGYGMEIKYQRARPAVAGMPTEPTTTIIRHNVWIKSDRPSPDGNRPNLLVGGFPDTGLGAMDRYEIYGNVFLHNPRESLLQASGRVSIHDNLFIDVTGTAILLRNHDLPLRQAFVYHNTIYAAGRGVVFGSAAAQGDAVVGNVIFSPAPISGTITTQRDNVTGSVADAVMNVRAPSIAPGMIDLYPLVGRCQGAASDVTAFAADHDYDRDFNCTPRGSNVFRGAYAGEGSNPGWRVAAERQTTYACAMAGDGGVADAGTVDASSPDATPVDANITDATAADVSTRDVYDDAANDAAVGAPRETSAAGCGCRASPPTQGRASVWLIALAGLGGWRRRARRTAIGHRAVVR